MKKSKKTALTALMFAAAMGVGCTNPFHSEPQAVYGPPQEPEIEDPQEVYGPPVEDVQDAEPDAETTETSGQTEPFAETDTLAPFSHPQLVYGPPDARD